MELEADAILNPIRAIDKVDSLTNMKLLRTKQL